jgi:hypothetical protein
MRHPAYTSLPIILLLSSAPALACNPNWGPCAGVTDFSLQNQLQAQQTQQWSQQNQQATKEWARSNDRARQGPQSFAPQQAPRGQFGGALR